MPDGASVAARRDWAEAVTTCREDVDKWIRSKEKKHAAAGLPLLGALHAAETLCGGDGGVGLHAFLDVALLPRVQGPPAQGAGGGRAEGGGGGDSAAAPPGGVSPAPATLAAARNRRGGKQRAALGGAAGDQDDHRARRGCARGGPRGRGDGPARPAPRGGRVDGPGAPGEGVRRHRRGSGGRAGRHPAHRVQETEGPGEGPHRSPVWRGCWSACGTRAWIRSRASWTGAVAMGAAGVAAAGGAATGSRAARRRRP